MDSISYLTDAIGLWKHEFHFLVIVNKVIYVFFDFLHNFGKLHFLRSSLYLKLQFCIHKIIYNLHLQICNMSFLLLCSVSMNSVCLPWSAFFLMGLPFVGVYIYVYVWAYACIHVCICVHMCPVCVCAHVHVYVETRRQPHMLFLGYHPLENIETESLPGLELTNPRG